MAPQGDNGRIGGQGAGRAECMEKISTWQAETESLRIPWVSIQGNTRLRRVAFACRCIKIK